MRVQVDAEGAQRICVDIEARCRAASRLARIFLLECQLLLEYEQACVAPVARKVLAPPNCWREWRA